MSILHQKAPNEFMSNNLSNLKTNFRNAQHITKLLSYLKNSESKITPNEILQTFSHYITNDPILKSIFDSYEWNEEFKRFNCEIKTQDLVDKLILCYNIESRNDEIYNVSNQSIKLSLI